MADDLTVKFKPPAKAFTIGSPRYGFSRGEFQLDMPGASQQVIESFTCGHCNRVTQVMPFCDPADAGGYCRTCTRLVCRGCAGQMRCDPIEKKLERAEARGEAIRSYGF